MMRVPEQLTREGVIKRSYLAGFQFSQALLANFSVAEIERLSGQLTNNELAS